MCLNSIVTRHVFIVPNAVISIRLIFELKSSRLWCPFCQYSAVIRPDIVFYGESLNMDYGALNALSHKRKSLIVAGSSLSAYRRSSHDYYEGNKMVIINDQPAITTVAPIW